MDAVTVIEDLQVVVFVVLALLAGRFWWRDRTPASACLAGAFVALALVLVGSWLLPAAEPGAPRGVGVQLVLVAGLLAFSLLLVAFAWAFEERLPTWFAGASGVAAGMLLWLLLLPPLPTGTPRTPAQDAFVAAFVVLWGGLATVAAVRLWRAGGAQRLVRARMRLLSAGALALTLALLLAVFSAGHPAVALTGDVVVVLAGVLFLTGFAPPTPLRQWWRRNATREWQRMQEALIAAVTPGEVGAAVAPLIADVLGGAVAIVGPEGEVLATAGMDDAAGAEVARALSAGAPLAEGDRVVAVDRSWLVVHSTAYTPLLGSDEDAVLEGFALQLRLALERAALFDAERKAREDAERAREELEATLAGLSHDLRSPTTAITGFAALLPRARDEGHRQEMQHQIEEAAAYLNRLVDALLDLSRVGRTQTDVAPVDLARVVATVQRRLGVSHPHAEVVISTRLPIVLMNPARAEQLFDNLLSNAAKHAGRDDVTITVSSRAVDGGVELVVGDDGQGVGDQDRAELFSLFGRGRSSATGSGVGLNLVRRIVESYGGTIDLADADGGARFVIALPDSSVDRTRAPTAG